MKTRCFSLLKLLAVEDAWDSMNAAQHLMTDRWNEYIALVPAVQDAGGTVFAASKDSNIFHEYLADGDGFSEGVSSGKQSSPLGERVHLECRAHRAAAIAWNEAKERYEAAWKAVRDHFEAP